MPSDRLSSLAFTLYAERAAEEARTPGCAGWASVGECTANKAFMLASCPHACSAWRAAAHGHSPRPPTTTDDINMNDIEGWSRLFSETLNVQKALYCIITCFVGVVLIIYLLYLFWKMQGPLSSMTDLTEEEKMEVLRHGSVSRASTTTTTSTTISPITAINSTTTLTTDKKHSKQTSFSFSYGYLTWMFGSVPLTCQWLCLMISLFYDLEGVTHTRY